MTNGDLGISCYCSIKNAHKEAIGNVNDGKNLSEMITEWNYKTPLTCDEACDLEATLGIVKYYNPIFLKNLMFSGNF